MIGELLIKPAGSFNRGESEVSGDTALTFLEPPSLERDGFLERSLENSLENSLEVCLESSSKYSFDSVGGDTFALGGRGRGSMIKKER